MKTDKYINGQVEECVQMHHQTPCVVCREQAARGSGYTTRLNGEYAAG